MEVLKAIESRRSIRKYKPTAIPDEKLKMILEAARLAPSAGNRQPWRFVIARGSEVKKRLAEAARSQMWIADAGAVVVALADREASPRWFEKDVMIAVEHMVLAAWSLGYGTCWIGAFEEEKVKQLLKIPEKVTVVALLPIGEPDEKPQPKPRKEFGEIFSEDEYGKKLSL